MRMSDLIGREDLPENLKKWLEKNDLQKMKDGEWFSPGDEEVCQARIEPLIFRFNHSCPGTPEYDFLLSTIIKSQGHVRVVQPFYAEFGNINAGSNLFIGNNCSFVDGGGITIGDNVLIAPRVVIATATHPLDPKLRNAKIVKCSPVVIEDNVWIGANATILGGVTIGKNSVVGAGSVVTKDIPENSLALGSPCKVVKKLTVDKDLEELYAYLNGIDGEREL